MPARLLLVLAALSLPLGAWAQTAVTQNPDVTLSEVVVTGSHIPVQAGGAGVSQVAAVSKTELATEGDVRLEDAIARMPQALPGQSLYDNNGATGIATVNLRGLGEQRTLVLVDGKRLMPGDPTTGSVAPDLNFIPTAIVEHVEIVTGGASAVYGSDAIAGVVNIILDHKFRGLKLEAQSGIYTHTNGDTAIQDVLTEHGVSLPPAQVDDGLTYDLNLVAGFASPDDRAELQLYGGYRHSDPVTQSQRDFSSCALGASGSQFFCHGSGASPALGLFVPLDAGFNELGEYTLDPAGPTGALRTFDSARDGFNFAPYNYYQRSDQRWTAGAMGSFAASPRLEIYGQAMFMDDRTTAQLAPSGLFGAGDPAGDPFTLSCANPMFSAAELQAFCGGETSGTTTLFIAHRDVEGDPRQVSYEHRDWRLLGGLRGEWGPWSYDVSVQHGAVDFNETILNDVSLARAVEALNVVRNASGALVCASGASGCVPYDVFQLGGVSAAAIRFLSVPGRAAGGTSETVISATASGRLGDLGVRSPLARDGVGAAVGFEYRRDGLSYAPDAEFASGDLADQGAATPPVAGASDVVETYGELRVPVAQDLGPLVRDLDLEAGYRLSDYDRSGVSWTYKAAGIWRPIDALRFRASFNHAVRAPNVVELFTPQLIGGIDLQIDPCAGANPADPATGNPLATAANCARTGVTAAEYGHIALNPNGYNGLVGGNPNLRPETANTVTAGAEVQFGSRPNLQVSLDWFDVDITGAIGQIGADNIVEECLQTGEPSLCQLIHRAPGTGSLWLSNLGYVTDINQNTAQLHVRGVDVAAVWRFYLPQVDGVRLGSASLDLAGTWTENAITQPFAGALVADCAGYYGTTCGQPHPRWKHILRLDWTTPWGVDIDAAWRFIAAVRLDASSTQPALAQPFDAADAQLGARSYFDLSLGWKINRHLTLRIGANNLFDTDPPLAALNGTIGNGNTYPSTYDSLGRFLFANLTARL